MDLKPTFFVMENVTGLIKQKSNKEYLVKLLKKLQDQYFIDYKTLNALNFGVPQNRERVFFVGIRKNAINKKRLVVELSGHWFSWPVNSVYQDSLTKYSWPDACDYGKRLTKPSEIPIELCVESCLIHNDQIEHVSNASEYFRLHVSKDKLDKIQEGQTNRPSFKRLHRFRYSPTACYGNNEVHLHPYKHRRISVREALRIQGVPDEYVLPPELPLSKKFKMIGNGVPVPLAEAVANALNNFLENNEILKTKKANGYMVKGKEKPGNVQNQRKKHKA
jgi:DNA (cytosine-5)-methyltransferase 1